MTDLKNCPFCESNDIDILTYEEEYHTRKVAECMDCGARGSVCDFKEEAIEAWNTRPAEDALKMEVEELKEALKKCRVLAIHINPRGVDKLKVIYEWMKEIERIADEALGKDTNIPANAPDAGKMEEN